MNLTCASRGCDCSLDNLSLREHEVLEHLASHKTSKQIAIDLGVTENTVNKHIASVKAKWRTADRYETVRAFRALVEGDKIHPPQIPSRDEYLIEVPDAFADLPRTAEFRLSDVLAKEPFRFPDSFAPAGLEALDARFGKAWRIVAVPVVAFLIGMVMMVMIAITQAMNELL